MRKGVSEETHEDLSIILPRAKDGQSPGGRTCKVSFVCAAAGICVYGNMFKCP